LTVVVAWGCSFLSVRDRGVLWTRYVVAPEGDSWTLDGSIGPGCLGASRYRGAGAVVWEGVAVAAKVQELPGTPLGEFRERGKGTPDERVPAWARREAIPWVTGAAAWPDGRDWTRARDWRQVDARGWPLPALYCVRRMPTGEARILHGGIVVSSRVISDGHSFIIRQAHPVTLPVLPIWRNVLADAGSFAGLLYVVLFAPGHVRRLWRRRSGVCGGCGYDLRGNIGGICPECGGGACEIRKR
jgi:hypothetical protein